MNDETDPDFWTAFAVLPAQVRDLARKRHSQWLKDPFAPSLHFKELGDGIWSVRVNQQYRALARRSGDHVVWFWIGSHAEYDRLIKG